MAMSVPVRTGCCADWPKPCPYHEGVQDALNAVFDGLVAIARECSPSALPETRQKCIEAVDARNPDKKAHNSITGWRPRWWDEYPLGHLTRLAYRLFGFVNEHDASSWCSTWDVPGEELPRIGG